MCNWLQQQQLLKHIQVGFVTRLASLMYISPTYVQRSALDHIMVVTTTDRPTEQRWMKEKSWILAMILTILNRRTECYFIAGYLEQVEIVSTTVKEVSFFWREKRFLRTYLYFCRFRHVDFGERKNLCLSVSHLEKEVD